MNILILSSHTKSLFWFRKDLMSDMINRGYTVFAIGDQPESEWCSRFQKLGIIYRQVSVSRNGINPFVDIKSIRSLKKVIKEISPDKIFVYQAKTISYGCLVSSQLGITEVYPMVAGLGSVFRGTGIKNTVVKWVISCLYRMAFKRSKIVFFQNNDDKQYLIKLGLLNEAQTVVVNGSGVNVKYFAPTPFPNIPTFLFIGRLIRDKGIIEYLDASVNIKKAYGDKVRCILVGPFDTNPSSISPDELRRYIEAGVEYCGEQDDVRPFISQCSIYVLPSYHEGTPKTVLEAMAMGRAIITTDAPGCRETVKNNMNGFLVKIKDTDELYIKMKYMVENINIVAEMGKISRSIAEEKYDVSKVNSIILSSMGL